MLVLGIETSTPQVSITLGSEQGIVGSCLVSRGSTSGEFLIPAIEFVMNRTGLSFRNISAVAVGLGPGLFTSMRHGVATAKTIAHALSIPIVGVSSLDLLAFDARYADKLICPAVDAKKNEIFFSFYRRVPGGISRVGEYSIGTPERLLAEIEGFGSGALLVGNGALLHQHKLDSSLIEFGSISSAFPRATSLIELSLPRLLREDFDPLFDIEPMYMRRSDAEINWEGRN